MLSGVRLIDPSGDDDQEGNRRKDRTKNKHRKHEEVKNKEKKSRKHRRERESEGKRHEEDDRVLDRDALRQDWEKSDKEDTQRYGNDEIAKTQGWEGELVQMGDKPSAREEWMTVPLARPKSQEAVQETREEKVSWRILVYNFSYMYLYWY